MEETTEEGEDLKKKKKMGNSLVSHVTTAACHVTLPSTSHVPDQAATQWLLFFFFFLTVSVGDTGDAAYTKT